MTAHPSQQISRFHHERVAAHQAFQKLEEAIANLQNEITADSDLPALVHALPYQGTTETGEAAGLPPWDEPPLEGEAARSHANAEIGRLRCQPAQDPKTVTRAPGVLGASPATLEAADAVNRAKAAFWTEVQKISPRMGTRRRELEAMISRLSLMQTRREISIWDSKPKRVSFTWAGRTSSIRTLTAGEMDAELGRRLRHIVSETCDQEDWKAVLEQGRRRLAELPESEPVAFDMPMAPHVRAHVYLQNELGEEIDRKMMAAPLPLLYPDDGRGPVPIKPLPAFDPQAKGRSRSNTYLEDEPIVEGLSVFRYREEWR